MLFVENVTDVDDKIIVRAHTAHAADIVAAVRRPPPRSLSTLRTSAPGLGSTPGRLCATRLTAPPPLSLACSQAQAAAAQCVQAGHPAAAAACTEAAQRLGDALPGAGPSAVEAACRSCCTSCLAALPGGGQACTGPLAALTQAWDVQTGFEQLARLHERGFLEDMDSLNVLRPDVLTRVTEYMPAIVDFIVRLVASGSAYEAGGSVYFDVAHFSGNAGHKYGKLVHNLGIAGAAGGGHADEAALQSAALAEAEGVLSGPESSVQKHNAVDFALWKASKAGEPSWDSPWGPGRPGWHIECSAMCSDVLGGQVDINGGGIDLAFPHHENQLAQSEAYWGCSQWVQTFLHTGHLHIDGLKMSKSLKNFVTIRAALKQYSPRQLRLLFLQNHWAQPMELTPVAEPQAAGAAPPAASAAGRFTQCEAAVITDRTLCEFFHSLKGALRSGQAAGAVGASPQALRHVDKALVGSLERCKVAVHDALCDNVDTPTALKALLTLVKACNSYMNDAAAQPLRLLLLAAAGRYVTRTLGLFGCVMAPSGCIGFGDAEVDGGGGASTGREAVLAPYLDALVAFRAEVRALALKATSGPAGPGDAATAALRQLLVACDTLRDDQLPSLGVQLDDRAGAGDALWKLRTPAELRADAEDKRAREAAVAAAKAEQLRRQAEKDARAAVAPTDMFRPAVGLPEYQASFSAWDDATGFPTADAEGQPLSKSGAKKLQKAQEQQQKAHDAFLAAQFASLTA